MRSLIIIGVVLLTFIAVALLMPLKKDTLQLPADSSRQISAPADSTPAHAHRPVDDGPMAKDSAASNQHKAVHLAHKGRGVSAAAIAF
jgi:hypothetical protein